MSRAEKQLEKLQQLLGLSPSLLSLLAPFPPCSFSFSPLSPRPSLFSLLTHSRLIPSRPSSLLASALSFSFSSFHLAFHPSHRRLFDHIFFHVIINRLLSLIPSALDQVTGTKNCIHGAVSSPSEPVDAS